MKNKELATKMQTIMEWYRKNQPTRLQLLADMPSRYFVPPIDLPGMDYLQWVTFHPESAQIWINRLEAEKEFIGK